MSKLSTLDNPLERMSGADKPKENPFAVDGDPFLNAESEQRAWDEHKDECNGCALCEL